MSWKLFVISQRSTLLVIPTAIFTVCALLLFSKMVTVVSSGALATLRSFWVNISSQLRLWSWYPPTKKLFRGSLSATKLWCSYARCSEWQPYSAWSLRDSHISLLTAPCLGSCVYRTLHLVHPLFSSLFTNTSHKAHFQYFLFMGPFSVLHTQM